MFVLLPFSFNVIVCWYTRLQMGGQTQHFKEKTQYLMNTLYMTLKALWCTILKWPNLTVEWWCDEVLCFQQGTSWIKNQLKSARDRSLIIGGWRVAFLDAGLLYNYPPTSHDRSLVYILTRSCHTCSAVSYHHHILDYLLYYRNYESFLKGHFCSKIHFFYSCSHI